MIKLLAAQFLETFCNTFLVDVSFENEARVKRGRNPRQYWSLSASCDINRMIVNVLEYTSYRL